VSGGRYGELEERRGEERRGEERSWREEERAGRDGGKQKNRARRESGFYG